MAFVIKTAKTIRNNWKKSAVGAGLLGYGVNYLIQKYQYVFVKQRKKNWAIHLINVT